MFDFRLFTQASTRSAVRGALFLVAITTCGATGSNDVFAQMPVASASADEAEVEFRLGNEAYVRGDYQKALSHYFASNRLVSNRNVLFNVAKCYENLGRFVEAYRYYTSYLGGVSEEAERKSVSEAIARIRKKVGLLSIESVPSGATIYLDRKDLGSYGETPTVVPVTPGEYDVILELPGYHIARIDDLDVRAGKLVEQDVSLAMREGEVSIAGTPSSVVITTGDGVARELDRPTKVRLPLGEQTVTIAADGYQTQTVTFEVREDGATALDVALERETGVVVVQASETSSAIYIDGELIGFSPIVVDDVPAGPHRVVVRQDGFQPYESDVVVEPNGRLEIAAILTGANEVAAASRRAEALRDAPASVSLISSREISAFGYTGTQDALRGTRGLYYTNDLTYFLPGIRGYGPFGQFGNRTLVLLDGHAVNDNWLEASFHEFELLSDIYGLDRIELVRGPTSVLYGSGAFQGVISLASPAIDDQFQPSRIGGSAVGEGVVRSYAHLREVLGPVGVQLDAGVVHGQPRPYTSEALGETAPRAGDFVGYTLRANVSWEDFQLRSFFHTRDKQSPTGAYEVIFGDTRAHESDTRGFVDLAWNRRLVEAASVEARAYVDTYRYEGTFPYEVEDGGVFLDTFVGAWSGGEARAVLRPFAGARWTVGIEGSRHFRQTAFSFTEDGNIRLDLETPFTKLAGSVMARQDFTPRLAVWAGARYDLWLFDALPDASGGSAPKSIANANPRLVLIARPWEQGTLKLIGSRGFRAPSVFELTYNDGGLTQISSSGLDPETIWSGEAELTHEFDENWAAVVATYLQRIDDRIESTGEALPESPLQFQNIDADLWSGGVEFEIRRTFFRGWMAAAQYSLQRTREGDLDAFFDAGTNAPNSPAHLAAAKFVVPIVPRALNLANRVVYESERVDRAGGKTRPAVLWDVAFSGEATPVDLRYSLGMRNLLDWTYEHPVGDEIADVTVKQPGRTVMLDIALQF